MSTAAPPAGARRPSRPARARETPRSAPRARRGPRAGRTPQLAPRRLAQPRRRASPRALRHTPLRSRLPRPARAGTIAVEAERESAQMEPEDETFPDLPTELWIHVLVQGGPALLSSCSRLCKQLHQGISESSELHCYYAQECFAVTNCGAHKHWREALMLCCRQWRSHPALPAWAGRFLSITPRSPYQMEPLQQESWSEQPLRGPSPLGTSVVAHTDHAGEFEAYGFPPANALSHNGVLQRCWCTSTAHYPYPYPYPCPGAS